jgi:GNAT superfamily N-acetyltransferase
VTYRIIKVPSADAEDAVADLHFACFASHYWDETAHWWLVNDHTGGSVAFGGLRVSKTEGGAYLCRAGVHPQVRGNGLQTRLIQAREKWARKQGLRFLVTDTIFGNNHSVNNLISCGFRAYSPITPWGHETNSYWRKELT